jgi:hypothetical protein
VSRGRPHGTVGVEVAYDEGGNRVVNGGREEAVEAVPTVWDRVIEVTEAKRRCGNEREINGHPGVRGEAVDRSKDRRADRHEGVVYVNESLGLLIRCEDRAEASPFVVGGPSKDWKPVGVGVRTGSGNTSEPRFLDGEDVMIGRLEKGMHHVIAAAHVHRQYLNMV